MRVLIKLCFKLSYKGDYGSVFLIGGFYFYGGVIIMVVLVCVKIGVGLVIVVI